MSGLLRIGDVEVAENSRKEFWLKTLELDDGSPVNIPVIVLNGSENGPTVFVGAGAHGDEINTIRSVIDAASQLDSAKLKGIVIAVPVQNTLAFRDRQRLITLNQLDQLNMHRTFPGDPEGDSSSRISHLILNRLILETGVELVMDLHTGYTGSICPPHTFVPPKKHGEVAEKSKAAAEIFNAGILLQAEATSGVYAHSAMLHMIVAERGIPSFGCEIGRGLVAENRYIDLGTKGILNVLRHLGMIESPEPIKKEKQILVTKVTNVRARRGGICCLEMEPGAFINKGGLIATITDLFGRKVEEILSPVDAYAITLSAFPMVHEGERVARLGSH